MDAVLKIVQTVNMYLSDYILIIMLIGCGLYFSIRTKFVQVRCFGEGWRKMFGNFSLKGGSGGCYVKTIGKAGPGRLSVNDIEIEFNINM